MNVKEIAAELRAEADRTCDPELGALLTLAARALERAELRGPCLLCTRAAEVSGLCRPCYQRHRRATSAGKD